MKSTSRTGLVRPDDAGDVLIHYGSGPGYTVPLDPIAEATTHSVESWGSGEASHTTAGDWRVARLETGLSLYAAQFDSGAGLEELTRSAYADLLARIAADGLQPVRLWNYVLDINAEDDALERYRRFSVGRYEGFLDHGYKLSDDLPAATAVGTRRGPQLSVVALASRESGRQIENPRQVSAWAYPERYGPRSPSFSRATVMQHGTTSVLWLSGTASIIGHETVHVGDPLQQTDETFRNMDAVLEHAGFGSNLESMSMLKVYVRHPQHVEPIRNRFRQLAGREIPAIWLMADICRAELLLEIEGVAMISA